MIRLIISIVLLLGLCALVVLNLNYTTSVSIFWVTFDRVSVVAVAIVSFVSGVLYSFFLYAARYIAGLRRGAPAGRRADLDGREKEAVAREEAGAAPSEPRASPVSDAAAAEHGAAQGTSPGARHRRRPRSASQP